MKATQQGENLLVSLKLISLHFATDMCGAFTNRILLSSYSELARAMAIACVDLETSVAAMTNNS